MALSCEYTKPTYCKYMCCITINSFVGILSKTSENIYYKSETICRCS